MVLDKRMTPLGDNRVLLGTEKKTAAAKQLSCLVLEEFSDISWPLQTLPHVNKSQSENVLLHCNAVQEGNNATRKSHQKRSQAGSCGLAISLVGERHRCSQPLLRAIPYSGDR